MPSPVPGQNQLDLARFLEKALAGHPATRATTASGNTVTVRMNESSFTVQVHVAAHPAI